MGKVRLLEYEGGAKYAEIALEDLRALAEDYVRLYVKAAGEGVDCGEFEDSLVDAALLLDPLNGGEPESDGGERPEPDDLPEGNKA